MAAHATFEAVRRNLPAIRDFIETKAAEMGADADPIFEVMAAVDELATNVVMHGYADQGGPLEVEVGREGDALVVRLRDQAPAFDPTALPPPDTSIPIEDRPIGGMGVFIVRKYTDSFAYRALPGGGNELILMKRIA
jgi:serine/threonine-protein kinase RsbW